MLIDEASIAGGSDSLVINYLKSGLLLEVIERGVHWVSNGQMDPFDVRNIADDTVFNAASLFGLKQFNLLETFNEVSSMVPASANVQNAVSMGVLITALQNAREYVRVSSLKDTPLKYITNVSSLWY
jgi:hypothetical protein